MMEYKTGFIIRYLREKKGWSQRELAKRVGLSQTNINKIENNEYKLNKIETVNKFLKAFHIEFDVLFRDYINAFHKDDLSTFHKKLIDEMEQMDIDELKDFHKMILAFIEYKKYIKDQIED